MTTKTRGRITFVFDDGYQHIYDQVVPLLEEYRFPGVFAIPLDAGAIERTEHRPTHPWRTWLQLRSRGHEIAAHSISHVNLTQVSNKALDQELREPAQRLQAHTLVYPGGACDQRVAAAAATYYRAARTTRRGFESRVPDSPLQLKTFNFTRNNFSPFRANRLALWAFLTNQWIIETYHLVDDQETEKEHAVPLTGFRRHLRFVSQLPLQCSTIAQALQQL